MSEPSERVVERERILDAEPERVWDALTDDGLLADWFELIAALDAARESDAEEEE